MFDFFGWTPKFDFLLGGWDIPSLAPDLSGKVAIVTGGNSGIGYEAAKVFACKGAHVIVASPSEKTALGRVKEIDDAIGRSRSKGQVEWQQLNLASLKNVQQFADRFKERRLPLHILVCNAGALAPKDAPAKSEDGFDITLGINHFGHVLLVELLRERLAAAAPSRLVFTSSPGESLGRINWDDLSGEANKTSDFAVYSTSKLYNLMTSRELARRLAGSGVDVFAAQPGIAQTRLVGKGDFFKPAVVLLWIATLLFGQSERRGALSIIKTATDPELQGHGGEYYGPYYLGPNISNIGNTSQCRPWSHEAKEAAPQRRLYEETLRILSRKTGLNLQGGAGAAA